MRFNPDQLAALAALGIAPAAVAGPTSPGEDETAAPARRCLPAVTLDDAEWAIIAATGALPPDPPQAQAMATRTLLGALLAVIPASRAWTDLEPGLPAEVVRKRFARLAAKGVWQRLASALADSALAADRKRQFAAIARRAVSLRRRAPSRRC